MSALSCNECNVLTTYSTDDSKSRSSSNVSSFSTIDAINRKNSVFSIYPLSDSSSTIDTVKTSSLSTIDAVRTSYKPSSHQKSCMNIGEQFYSIITPVNNLVPEYSGMTGNVQFRMRRKNKSIVLQWEPFSGIMAASGISYLTVPQTIANLPPYPISLPILIKYKDINRYGHLTVDPHNNNSNISFYLGQSSDITFGDSFYVYGGTANWVID